MPSARSIITIAVVSGLTFIAIEHFKARGGVSGVTGGKVGTSRVNGLG